MKYDTCLLRAYNPVGESKVLYLIREKLNSKLCIITYKNNESMGRETIIRILKNSKKLMETTEGRLTPNRCK